MSEIIPAHLSRPLIDAAHKWWVDLPSNQKGGQSIWVLLAMFAHDAHRGCEHCECVCPGCSKCGMASTVKT